MRIKVVSSAISTRRKVQGGRRENSSVLLTHDRAAIEARPLIADRPFLRIPPFPGAKVSEFHEIPGPSVDTVALADRLRRLRVGGSYWGAQPSLAPSYLLVRSPAALHSATAMFPELPVVLWSAPPGFANDLAGIMCISGDCDPWHMLAGAKALVAPAGEELQLIAALLGISRYESEGAKIVPAGADAECLLEPLAVSAFENPFTGAPMNAIEVAELAGEWRRLIDLNRNIAGGLGFAFWKQAHVAPLLWSGTEQFRFMRTANEAKPGERVAVWRSKVPAAVIKGLESRGNAIVEVEDGFLRSHGLGADCIPPISITADPLGPHFDVSQPSELELLLQNGAFDGRMLTRARDLRRMIVEAGLGKYGRGTQVLDRPAGKTRLILVPGQVEDDRSVQLGGCGLVSNLDLLARVRGEAPDAYILYKPHPDVLAGHRRGHIPDAKCLRYADRIVGGFPMASLLAMVDEVHVNTSLAGFEALLRGKPVTTYGVPFFAGWGLTRDLGCVPLRRTARRTIDELTAAALLLYPRYLDPVAGLPCPAEIAVSRLCANDVHGSFIVGMRRLQGKVMRHVRRIVQ